MERQQAEGHVRHAQSRSGSFGRGRLVSTFSVRHRAGLDVAFVLDGAEGDFQIGMGAASEDYSSVMSLGVDSREGRLRAVGHWTVDGRAERLTARIVLHDRGLIVVEATPLPLAKRPRSLKCWSFLRQDGVDHHSDVIGLVAPELASLPPVTLRTYPPR
ncbi:hypothetical protein [Rathayibacter sp. SD072]|uniref:hypothetical protein n=1 Tax=Rathayibacter sp. SD072 TaxID=2781731 RepID=UPI001A9600A1|nr:hypothetical protein [Rathayibacter sp. SD072]MBO0983594.1 hypothetical protein [Rathayibacter sp. SD072]